MSYSERTFRSPNAFVRFAHRGRMRTALKLTPRFPQLRLLDFGCGDGAFLQELEKERIEGGDLIGFEPYGDTRAQLSERTRILKEWPAVEEFFRLQPADVVTCFEVMEHLPPPLQADALERMRSILRPGGTLVVSVPIECGPPVLLKTITRYLHYSRIGNTHMQSMFNIRTAAKSFFGAPLPEYRTGFYLTHLGFYYWELEDLLARHFRITRRIFSPLNALGAALNSQVFYVAQPL